MTRLSIVLTTCVVLAWSSGVAVAQGAPEGQLTIAFDTAGEKRVVDSFVERI